MMWLEEALGLSGDLVSLSLSLLVAGGGMSCGGQPGEWWEAGGSVARSPPVESRRESRRASWLLSPHQWRVKTPQSLVHSLALPPSARVWVLLETSVAPWYCFSFIDTTWAHALYQCVKFPGSGS